MTGTGNKRRIIVTLFLLALVASGLYTATLLRFGAMLGGQ